MYSYWQLNPETNAGVKGVFPHVTGYRKSSQPNWPLLAFFIDSVINIRKEVAHLMSYFLLLQQKITAKPET